MKTFRSLVSASVALLLLSLVTAASEPRNVRSITIEGNATIPTTKILECLTRYPAVLAAAEGNHSDAEFLQAIEDTLRAGYKNAGFHECQISTSRDKDTWNARIVEGRRTLKDSLQVEGDAETSQWLSKALIDYQKDPNKSIWLAGYPWNGEEKLVGDDQKHLDDCLVELGINPRYITHSFKVDSSSSPTIVRLVLNVPAAFKPTRMESLKCDAADRELILSELAKHDLALGSRVDPATPARVQKILLASGKFDNVDVKLDPGHGLGDVALNVQGTRWNASSAAIAARQKVLVFGERVDGMLAGARGLHLTMSADTTLANVWVFEKSFAVELAKNKREIARLFNNTATDKMVIETGDDSRYPFGLPNFEMRFGVRPHETESDKWNFDFGGDFKTDREIVRANRFQLNLKTLCTMFPLAETELIEMKDGYVIQSRYGRLHAGANDEFKSLSLKCENKPEDVWLLESIHQFPEHVRKLEVTEQDQLAFTVPETQPTASKSQKDAFYVFADSKNLTAAATFWFVDEVLKYKPDSAVYALAEIFSISNTSDQIAVQAASQRWLSKYAQGPFSTLALAYCYANAHDSKGAADYATQAMQLLTSEESLRRDLDHIFIENSTLGIAAGKIDARHLHKLISETARAFETDETVTLALRMTEPPAAANVEQWKFIVSKLVPIALQAPMQSIASHLQAGPTRQAARP